MKSNKYLNFSFVAPYVYVPVTEYYDPFVDSWLYGPTIPGVAWHCATPIQGKTKILLLGGYQKNPGSISTKAKIFDPDIGKS